MSWLFCQQPGDLSSSKLNSNGSQLVLKCRLLDWLSVEDLVIGEGEYCTSEPTYKVGGIPLGPNAAAVIIKSVTKKDAYVWRPTTTVEKLGQAVGMIIAWQADKIMLDKELDSPTPTDQNQTSVASVMFGLILTYDYETV